ncbi:right-handed parallel beta-helix repeat-containing protein [Paenibacillus alvei]|uniref:right-handed parallel beta-helix repeat-containing protein n=1 Tax=Paenibacillus alvei TaxID=44250 RepID=UPI0021CF3DDB|nr:right-handed parallel beta-helix repeat-containing protein [Paenibacillus alvei]MCY9540088.1 right-handed parallel beta-helix repeat-containing protein [Paenibacillus alvei]MCY9704666.1 right-handed parallel beta-helix repeat-containing protein [Paenibacillus alvei]MCY9732674.1 right-handed parallel beta-helix repeat-containing protein [Paenibacillus alvei]MCY9755005.1 right-handed parallel beta-helix repeat-containing protein [Paenibacillus alvei]MEC0079406.1 right-handed parallel beta-hel
MQIADLRSLKPERGWLYGLIFLLVISLAPTQALAWSSIAGEPLSATVRGDAKEITCNTTSCLSKALKRITPGSSIVLAPGIYKGSFSSDINGAFGQPIVIRSADPSHPAVLSGNSTSSGYAMRVRGDYWEIRDLKFTNAQKGIILDHSNYSLITDVEVYNTGMEGVHFRDGSSFSTIQNSSIHHTGRTAPGYGEGVYVGSADGAGYNQATHHNTIRNVVFGPQVTAEHVDIKERTLGTIVENCIFNGEGISGANYADSFMDVKGNDAIIRNNVGYQEGNHTIIDAFQLHEVVTGWGSNNIFINNKVHMDNSEAYVIAAYNNANAKAANTIRTPSGNMYKGNITAYVTDVQLK